MKDLVERAFLVNQTRGLQESGESLLNGTHPWTRPSEFDVFEPAETQKAKNERLAWRYGFGPLEDARWNQKMRVCGLVATGIVSAASGWLIFVR